MILWHILSIYQLIKHEYSHISIEFQIKDQLSSQSASKDVYNTYKAWCIPLDSNGSIDFIIPKAWSWNVKAAISFLHDDAIGNELKVSVNCCNILENLNILRFYVIADLIGPYLGIVDVVVFIGKVAADDVVDLLLNEWANVVEYGLFLLSHVMF